MASALVCTEDVVCAVAFSSRVTGLIILAVYENLRRIAYSQSAAGNRQELTLVLMEAFASVSEQHPALAHPCSLTNKISVQLSSSLHDSHV